MGRSWVGTWQTHTPRKLLFVDRVGIRGLRGELASLEILTRARWAPSRAVLSDGSSDMEPLLLCMREAGRERLRWERGEWGGLRSAWSSRSWWSMADSGRLE